MIDAPQKADGQWLFTFSLPIQYTGSESHFDNQLGLPIETFRSGKIEAYQRHRNKKLKRQQ